MSDLASSSEFTLNPPWIGSISNPADSANSVLGSMPTHTITWSARN